MSAIDWHRVSSNLMDDTYPWEKRKTKIIKKKKQEQHWKWTLKILKWLGIGGLSCDLFGERLKILRNINLACWLSVKAIRSGLHSSLALEENPTYNILLRLKSTTNLWNSNQIRLKRIDNREDLMWLPISKLPFLITAINYRSIRNFIAQRSASGFVRGGWFI